MKILVVQLLRLGDIIMSAPTIKAIKELHPNSEVHLLVNSQFKSVKNLLPGVDHFIFFNREKLQRKLKYRNTSYYGAFETMKNLTQYLKDQSYDIVVNLTHNKLSGYILGIINPPKHIGLKMLKDGSSDIQTSSFQFINNHGVEKNTTPHFVDIGLNAFLHKGKRQITLNETTAGFVSSKSILKQKKLDLLIQPLSSEEKKNWGENNLKEFIALYFKKNPGHYVGIICAPNEETRLRAYLQDLKYENLYFCVVNLETAFSIIKKSKILLTTDTSIKHLAAATNARIIELSIGSSQFSFTGAYCKNSYILQSNQSCAPCGHDEICPYKHNICRDDFNADYVLRFVSAVQTRNHVQMKNLRSQSIYEVFVKDNLGYCPVPINLSVEGLFELIMRFKSQLHINKLHREKIYSEFYQVVSESILSNESSKKTLIDLYGQVVAIIDSLMKTSGAFELLNFLKQDLYILKRIVQFYLRENNLNNIEDLFSPHSVFSFSGIIREELDFYEFILIKLMDQIGDFEWKKNKNLKNLQLL